MEVHTITRNYPALPGSSVSLTSRAFSSALHRRRRSLLVMISTLCIKRASF
jgi:hypothetical protein